MKEIALVMVTCLAFISNYYMIKATMDFLSEIHRPPSSESRLKKGI